MFFDYEAEFGVICTDKEAELSYVRHLSDLLLYLLLPETSFQCYPMRTLLRELIATCGAIPSMDVSYTKQVPEVTLQADISSP